MARIEERTAAGRGLTVWAAGRNERKSQNRHSADVKVKIPTLSAQTAERMGHPKSFQRCQEKKREVWPTRLNLRKASTKSSRP
jgi:hypothetical protein